MKDLLNRLLRGAKASAEAPFTRSDVPYCLGCEETLPTFKIGKYVYHIHNKTTHSGCNIANRSNKDS